ncbi:hypothetical protein ACX27_15765 [Nostoc piscinale CENA21]|uniref:DUF4145 domain-containing protein n=1 Tax=Nostoc piscinale CENA21 TaxID=224013 RepID=A0A0M4T310_9NOSO|nr:hypothetical protein [Nostoc piscinale]ALF53982.1 hypothetical protein ACX27_15765 [Nostoc piscinale CENA21]
MELEEFCIRLNQINLSNAERALAILWLYDCETPNVQMTANQLARTIYKTGLGNPNPSKLGDLIAQTKLALKGKSGFHLKPTARNMIKDWLKPIFEGSLADVDLEHGYLPEAIWKNTRGYVEKIALQVNGCFQYGFYDGASVLLRRLVETLLIECYEHENVQVRISDSDGNYFMLSKIIADAVDKNGLSLGRETKNVLHDLKAIGDRAAHNRRYNAVRADLERIQLGVRLVVDELIQLAELRR